MQKEGRERGEREEVEVGKKTRTKKRMDGEIKMHGDWFGQKKTKRKMKGGGRKQNTTRNIGGKDTNREEKFGLKQATRGL